MEPNTTYELGFRERLDAMIGLAGLWASDKQNRPVITQLLNEFGHFACRYFQEISKFSSKEESPKIFNDALNRLQREWSTISQIAQQRRLDDLRTLLEAADQQAGEYYRHFTGFVLPEYPDGYKLDVPPITYFEKIYGITRCVFTAFPLISIPFQYMRIPDEWMALAHEMGHHLYWNACPLDQLSNFHEHIKANVKAAILDAYPIREYDDLSRREKVLEIWMYWLEETFADVVGVLFAGDRYVESNLRLAKEATKVSIERLLADDKEHPAWYIRPWILIESLNWIIEVENLPEDHWLRSKTDELRHRWTEYKAVQEIDEQEIAHAASGISMPFIKELVRPVVRSLLEAGVAVGKRIHYGNLWLYEARFQPPDTGEIVGRIRDKADEMMNNPASDSFETLHNFLRQKVTEEIAERDNINAQLANADTLIEEGIQNALLTLQWSDEDLFDNGECGWRKVEMQGGIWVKC